MATQILSIGKKELFRNGWTNTVNAVRLYQSNSTIVDTVEAEFSYNADDQSIRPTGDIVFNVGAGTNNVSFVSIGYLDSDPLIGFTAYYEKDLPNVYNFTIAGTLTIDSMILTISSPSGTISAQGKSDLWQNGWEGLMTTAKLYTSSDSLIDTKTVSFSVNNATERLELDSPITFSVSTPTNNVNKIVLSYNSGGEKIVFTRMLTALNFPTSGTLKVNSWTFSLGV